jgi:AraC-like DNA-binding protein
MDATREACDLTSAAATGLERSCGGPNWVRGGASRPGFERAEANFSTMRFAPHRHDAYAIGVTLRGVQSFGYRGTTEHSEAGCAFVIHPDEKHDGRAGTHEGFCYRIVYVEPRLISEALQGRALPFVTDAVTREGRLHSAICAALDAFDAPIEDLRLDDIIARLADALAAHDPAPQRADTMAESAVGVARACLDESAGAVSSAALERLTGLSRFELARQFRRCLGTSPHRYAVMRRLERARRLVACGSSLADAAAACGFADQSHMTRQFKRAYGVSPGEWRTLTRPEVAA